MQHRNSRPIELLLRFAIRRTRTALPIVIEPITAIRPTLVRHQSALHWISVHVIHLFGSGLT